MSNQAAIGLALEELVAKKRKIIGIKTILVFHS